VNQCHRLLIAVLFPRSLRRHIDLGRLLGRHENRFRLDWWFGHNDNRFRLDWRLGHNDNRFRLDWRRLGGNYYDRSVNCFNFSTGQSNIAPKSLVTG
jgi:hypothetical protein